MSLNIPVTGHYVALTVHGKDKYGNVVEFPPDAVITWSNSNPVVCSLGVINEGVETSRKILPVDPPRSGETTITCMVLFDDPYSGAETVSLTNTFDVIFDDGLPVEIEFSHTVEEL